MSYQAKFILPLINENTAKEDFDKESGFIDMYTEHLGYPTLQNHIFLLYKPKTATKKHIELHKKLKQFYNTYRIIRNFKEGTFLYILTITNNTLLRIQTGYFALNKAEEYRLMMFWNLEDSDINEYMCDHNAIKHKEFKQNYLT